MGPQTAQPLGRALWIECALMVLLAASSLLAVVLLFGWGADELLLGAPIGMVFWAGVEYVFSVRKRLPDGEVPAAPPGTVRSADGFGQLMNPSLLAVVLAAVAIAWLANAWDLGGVFVPGQFAGYALARAVAAVRVRRWEQRHDATIASGVGVDGKGRLYRLAAPGGAA